MAIQSMHISNYGKRGLIIFALFMTYDEVAGRATMYQSEINEPQLLQITTYVCPASKQKLKVEHHR